jgi:hypothetical protein
LFIPSVNAIIPFGAAALGVGLYTLFHPGLRRRESDDRPVTNPGNQPPGPVPRDRPVGARPSPSVRIVNGRGGSGDDGPVLTRPPPRPADLPPISPRGAVRRGPRVTRDGFADGRDEMR